MINLGSLRSFRMVYGHQFYFMHEPMLQKEFDAFTLKPNFSFGNRSIKVIECSDFPESDIFNYATKWYAMSGQEARYHSAVPFKEAQGNFSWALEIKDVVTLLWESKDKNILYRAGKNYTPKQLRFWIYHTFFPIVLELEHIYRILHVGSVEIKGKPVIFSAFSFGGKSTMTDYFIQKGHTMLSDDSLGIDKRGNDYYAIASYPFHRPYREPEVLGYPVKNFATEPKPLHAVYRLEKSEPKATVEINEVKGIEKFKAFHYSTFIDFSFMKQERFAFFTEMAKHVPVYGIKVPWDLERLSEVYEKIVEHSIR